MLRGVAAGFATYFVFTLGDAAVKSLGPGLSVFEIGFFATLISAPILLVAGARGDTWRDAFAVRSPMLLALRVVLATVSYVGGTFAFTTIPFAEAFALFFLAPAIATLLSLALLGERPSAAGCASVAVGLVGVAVAIRPGFRALEPGHAAAFATAFSVGASIVVLRRLTLAERRTTILGATMLGLLAVNGTLMIGGFRTPSVQQMTLLAAIGLSQGLGQLGFLIAVRHASAGLVGATHYSQLVWAVLLGALVFGEFPDAFMLAGLALIVVSGALTLVAAMASPAADAIPRRAAASPLGSP